LRAHKVLIIGKRDYIATVRTKAFLFGLVVAPVLFGGGSIAASFMKGKPDLKDLRIAVIDRSGVVAGPLDEAVRRKTNKGLFDRKTRQQLAPRYVLEMLPPAAGSKEQLLALSDRVRRGELAAVLEIGPHVLQTRQDENEKPPDGKTDDRDAIVSYYTNTGGIDEMRAWLNDPINDGVRSARLAQAGIDPARVESLFSSVPVSRLGLVERDARTGEIRQAAKRGEWEGFFVPFAVAMILSMIVMAGSAPMLQSVTQDKSQRVVEMLLGAATPFELLAGKVLGAVGVSITSSVLYVAGGLIAVHTLGLSGMLPLTILPWFYIYLLADVVMLCSLAAALGSACSTPQDAQSLAIVLLAPCLIPMFVLVPVLRQPNGMLATGLSLFPFFTPVLMLMRQAIPNGVPAWQPWVGLAGVLAITLAMVWAASRIFRAAILMHGQPPRLSEFVRWAVKG
jgi:ABC-2 type transport system permease protein